MTLGENIRRIRKEKGLSQSELGKRIGVSYQQIGQYENGKRNPKIETIDKIASALGVKIADITQSFKISDYKKTSEFNRLERRAEAEKGVVSILADIYGFAEEKVILGKYADSFYFLIGKENNQFILNDGVIDTLYKSIKASVPPLVDHMKTTQTENEYIKERLEELSDPELGEKLRKLETEYKNDPDQDQEN